MSTKLVEYVSSICLPCTCKGTVNVIMCTQFGQTVAGQIIDSSSSKTSCGDSWRYQIQYDSTDLPTGVTALASPDITGVVCEGCFTTYIKERFSSYVVNESTTYDSWDVQPTSNLDTNDIHTFTITNPSSVNTLKGVIGYRISHNLSSITPYATGIAADLYANSVIVPETRQDLAKQSTPGGTEVDQRGASVEVAYDIPPGESVAFTLRLTSANSTPGSGSSVAFAQMFFFGTTTSA